MEPTNRLLNFHLLRSRIWRPLRILFLLVTRFGDQTRGTGHQQHVTTRQGASGPRASVSDRSDRRSSSDFCQSAEQSDELSICLCYAFSFFFFFFIKRRKQFKSAALWKTNKQSKPSVQILRQCCQLATRGFLCRCNISQHIAGRLSTCEKASQRSFSTWRTAKKPSGNAPKNDKLIV